MIDLKEQVMEMYKFCAELYDINMEEILAEGQNHRSGTLGRMSDERDMFTIYNNIQIRDYEIAYTQLFRLVSDKLSSAVNVTRTDMVNSMKNAISLYQQAIPIIEKYEKWDVVQKEQFKQYLFNNNWLKEEEKTDELLNNFNWLWIARAKKSIHKGLVKVYSATEKYDHRSEIAQASYRMPDVIAITSDPIRLMPNPNLDDENEVHVAMYMKIEKIIDYSYFIFTFQFRGELYIATDKMIFSNPRVATCSRNPGRRREEYFDNIDLPYGIIDDIIEWRKDSKAITKNPGQEMYIKRISDYLPSGSKICVRLLLEEVLYNMIPYTGDIKQIAYVKDIKLIGDGSSNPFSKINYDSCERFYSEYVFPECTALTVVDKEKALAQYVAPDWLATQEEIVKLALWSEKEEMYKQKQQLLELSDKEFWDAKDKLNSLIKQNLDTLLEVALSGDQVFTYLVDVPPVNSDFTTNERRVPLNQFCQAIYAQNVWANSVIHGETGTGHSPQYRYHDCACCGLHEARGKVIISMTTYKQLVAILGMDRRELPFAFQNYNAYTHRPYIGNSILDNVNPEFLLWDYASQHYKNRYTIGVELDKRCFNKLTTKYRRFKRSLILLSYVNKCIVDIVDYDKFLVDNPHLNIVSQGFL